MKHIASLWLCAAAAFFISTQAQAQDVTPIRINAAGGAYTDAQGHLWSADSAFGGGTIARVGSFIAGTADDTLYRSERWGNFSYRFTVPAGVYKVTLKFVETYFSRSGQRLFNVAINGATVLANFDIVAAAGGPGIALDRTFATSVGGGTGNLLIQFIHLPGQPDDPKVNAIEILSADDGAPTITIEPADQTVVAGQPATFSVATSGTALMSYQWRKNGVKISGATSSSYTTPPAILTDNGAEFSVQVGNSAGGSTATSRSATLTVNAATRLLSADPAILRFGSIDVGGSGVLTSLLTNLGTASVTISGVRVSGAGVDASGIATGQVLLPGQTAALNVTLAPALAGEITGSATVLSDATNSPVIVSLSGIGLRLISHSARLQWEASTSSVVGYNVYSSTVSGGPYTRMTSSPLAATSFQDTTVESGRTYYYVVTSVDAASAESPFSNEASALIP